MKNKVKLSIIMPVYNTEKYVGESIDSILKQSFKYFEFIIIDDCSIDGSYEICRKYAKKDSRIRLFRNKKNMGISYTRNKLIELSNTNYIASQDSDDISLKNRLELSYKFLEKNKDYAVVSGNNIIINEYGKEIGFRKYDNNIDKIIFKKSPVSNPASMFRKDIFFKVGGYDNNVNYGLEDYDLWLRIYSAGYNIKIINKFFLKYRIREGQCKSNIKKVLEKTIETQRKYYNIMTLGDKIYNYLEKFLLLFPEKFIFKLFNLLEYKKYEKRNILD